MTTFFNSTQPIYLQIISRVLLAIAKGELPPGGKISPVRDMAANFKVNPNTMQKSLAKLEEMGYLYTEGTNGRYVTKNVELIENLKTSLPAEITANYIAEMLDCGMPRDEISDYVSYAIKGGEKNG
ncbi:MAG: GntR family transcriptional regulator [Clostridiales bacterium]|jgi:DNA-binding transcriptional regulator YhcF (GntR family)|nr:GntR family transcriptional regulator [Clostridiales bacterium]